MSLRDAEGLETLRKGRQKGFCFEDGNKEVLRDTLSLVFLPPDRQNTIKAKKDFYCIVRNITL